jgi:hypothetical protein
MEIYIPPSRQIHTMEKTIISEKDMIDEMAQVINEGGNVKFRTGEENVWTVSKKTARPDTAIYENSEVTARFVLEEERIVVTSEIVDGSKRFFSSDVSRAIIARIVPDGPLIAAPVVGNITMQLTMNVTVLGGGGCKPFLWKSLTDKHELRDLLLGLLRVTHRDDQTSDEEAKYDYWASGEHDSEQE